MKVQIFKTNMIALKRADYDYKKWVESNPKVEVVSTFSPEDGTIVVTYKEE